MKTGAQLGFVATAVCAAVFASLAACGGGAAKAAPDDDPAAYSFAGVDPLDLRVSDPVWIVPSAKLPPETPVMVSNNNDEIAFHEDRLFFSWRTNDTHFASRNAKMYVVSSADHGRTFQHELTIALGADVREPRLLSMGKKLQLLFFEAGTDMFAFEPKKMWRTTRRARADWTPLEEWGERGEIPWTLKVRGGKAWLTSYIGEHYAPGMSRIDVRFSVSSDGRTFTPVNPNKWVVYQGGVSEVAFEFDAAGNLWAVTRNEDGDTTGFGSHVCFAPKDDLADWSCSARSSPERYDSPAMFRQGSEIYLIARRDLGGPFDQMLTDLSFADQKTRNLLAYSSRPKRTAIYRIDQTTRSIVFLRDLPSAGDTAFPSVRRISARTLLVANYTSPPSDPERAWLVGQTASDGTQIYFVTLSFGPPEGPAFGVTP